MPEPSARAAFAAAAILALVIPAVARQAAERSLSVHVADAQSAPVEGARVSARVAGAAAPVATAVTDAGGQARLAPLPLGPIALHVEAAGFTAYDDPAALPGELATRDVAVTLQVAEVSAAVTVTADGAESIQVDAGASIPSGSLTAAAVRNVPLAAERIDNALPLVPGVVRTTKGEISVKGASEPQSAIVLNGTNADDPGTGTLQLELPLDSIASLEVYPHPYTAEYGQFTGGITVVETKRGGDAWHAEVNDFLPDVRIRSGHIVGVSDDTPRFDVNGPIVEDKLYLFQSASYTISKSPVPGLWFPHNETWTEGYSSFTQLDRVYSPTHTESLTLGFFPERQRYVGLDYFQPQQASPNTRRRDSNVTGRDNYGLWGGTLETALSYKRVESDVWGQGDPDLVLTPTIPRGSYFADLARDSERLTAAETYEAPTLSAPSGRHDLKSGVSFDRLATSFLFVARPVLVEREDGTIAERTVFDPTLGPAAVRSHHISWYAQDRWTVRPNLSLDLGLRFELETGFAEGALAPRVGVAWAPFGGARTIVRGGVGRFYDKVPLNQLAFAAYPARTVTELGLDGITPLATTRYVDVVAARALPANVTWNVQLDQVVTPWLSCRVNVVDSRTEHVALVDPVPVAAGSGLLTLSADGVARYRSLELTARIALPESSNLFVSYVRSRARGDLNTFDAYFGDIAAPLVRPNQYSSLPSDVPNRLVVWGSVALPSRITIAPIVEYRNGFPFSVRDAEQQFVGVRNTARFPHFLSIDAEVAKEFQVTRKYAVRLSLRGFNLTNHFNPRDVRANTADPGFGSFFAPSQRYVTGGFDVIF